MKLKIFLKNWLVNNMIENGFGFIHLLKYYVYTAGLTDEGTGTSLQEFISFQIKIIMQGTNTSTPPRLKDLRILALAT